MEIPKLEDCEFYHVMNLPGIGTIEHARSWDLRGRFGEYTGGVDFRGKSVIDVGAASGFISFEAEIAGASAITSFEAERAEQRELVPHLSDAHPDPDGSFFAAVRNSYAFAHHAYGSRAVYVVGDIYRLAASVEPHDISVVGQILVHLRDPIGALQQVAQITQETLVIAEGSFASDAPVALFLGSEANVYSWWHLSEGFYRRLLPMLGFEVKKVTKGNFRCNHPDLARDVPIWTYVAQRTRGTAPSGVPREC